MIEIEERTKIFIAKQYSVILLNDNITTMNFVVYILETIFHKTRQRAVEIMLEIHNNGFATCGNYTLDIAMSKKRDVLNIAKSEGFPLKCEIKEV